MYQKDFKLDNHKIPASFPRVSPKCICTLSRDQSPNFYTFMEPRNRFQRINSASLCILKGRYDNPISTRFLAPIDCLKIPAQHPLAAAFCKI